MDTLDLRKLLKRDIGLDYFRMLTSTVANVSHANQPSPLHHRKPHLIVSLFLYILVVQDYFTKWAEAIPLPNQIAATITRELVNSKFGMLDILHSDQGRNFESLLLRQTLDGFGVLKSRTTAYHPQGDGMVERSNCSLPQMLRSCVYPGLLGRISPTCIFYILHFCTYIHGSVPL